MTKYAPYAIIAILIVGALVFVSGKLNTGLNIKSSIKTDETITEIGTSPIPVSQVDLDDKPSVQAAVDAELNQIDIELSGIQDSDLDSSGLSDNQLEL